MRVYVFVCAEADGGIDPDHQSELQVEGRLSRVLRVWQRAASQRRQLPGQVLLRHPLGTLPLLLVIA